MLEAGRVTSAKTVSGDGCCKLECSQLSAGKRLKGTPIVPQVDGSDRVKKW